MSGKPLIIRPVSLNLSLPIDLYTRLSLHLFSQGEQRVPKGAYKEFFSQRVREFFTWERLDLGAGLGVIQGSPAAIASLRRILNGDS